MFRTAFKALLYHELTKGLLVMNMDIVVAQNDTKTNVQLVKNGKPTLWLVGSVALEVITDVAIAFCAYKAFRLFKK